MELILSSEHSHNNHDFIKKLPIHKITTGCNEIKLSYHKLYYYNLYFMIIKFSVI